MITQNDHGRKVLFADNSHVYESRLKEALLVGVEAVDRALTLGSVSTELEAHGALVEAVVELRDILDTGILESVAHTLGNVREEAGHRSLVNDGSGNTLSDLDDTLLVSKVALGGSLLHGFDGSHTTVLLEANAVLEVVLSRALFTTGKHGSHHDSRGTEGKSLGDLTRGGDTSISNDGHTVHGSSAGSVVDGGGLSTSDSADLLCGTNGTHTHTDAETIDTGLDEVEALRGGDNVATDDLKVVTELLLDPVDEFELVDGVTLGRVNDDAVNTLGDEGLEALAVVGAGSDGGTDEELLADGGLGGEGEVTVLLEVVTAAEADELVVVVDNGKLTLLGLAENEVGLVEGAALLANDEVSGHNLGKLAGAVLEEVNVAVGDETHKAGAHLAVDGDGDAGEATLSLDAVHIGDGVVGGEHDGVGDEAVLVPLDGAHESGLLLNGVVVVDDADTTLESHVDGHLALGHGVHGGGHEGQAKVDLLGELGVERHLANAEAHVARHEDHIIVSVRSALAELAEEVLCGVAVATEVVEVGEGLHGLFRLALQHRRPNFRIVCLIDRLIRKARPLRGGDEEHARQLTTN
mmetsp:Transcript_13474/g.25973  ORF Transcript_13474/g.25973 Transcript_13474/m.25973 type:complete len:580 (-) Transcript_13474:42-1781(-)